MIWLTPKIWRGIKAVFNALRLVRRRD